MDGPTGYNVRYRKAPGHAVVGLRVTPSTEHNARQVFEALIDAGMHKVEIWRSGKRLVIGGWL